MGAPAFANGKVDIEILGGGEGAHFAVEMRVGEIESLADNHYVQTYTSHNNGLDNGIVEKTMNYGADLCEPDEGDRHYVQTYTSRNNDLDERIVEKTANCRIDLAEPDEGGHRSHFDVKRTVGQMQYLDYYTV